MLACCVCGHAKSLVVGPARRARESTGQDPGDVEQRRGAPFSGQPGGPHQAGHGRDRKPVAGRLCPMLTPKVTCNVSGTCHAPRVDLEPARKVQAHVA